MSAAPQQVEGARSPSPLIAGVVLVEPVQPGLWTVTARIAGLNRGSSRAFSDTAEARRYGLELAQRRGLLLVDLSDPETAG